MQTFVQCSEENISRKLIVTRLSLLKNMQFRHTHPLATLWIFKEKESLAANVHCFKQKASRCKFDNDAATIRIL